MNGYLQKLRAAVLETGQHFHDPSRIPSGIFFDAPEGVLRLQILQDSMRKYKYFDALGMWLGQQKLWTKKEQSFLKMLAEEYLGRR